MTARAAATAAGKRAAAETRDARRVKAPAGPTKRSGSVRRSFVPATPRRVSGPAHGRGARAAVPAPASVRATATALAAATATARAAFSATATVVAAAAEVAPRIVRPAPRITRPVREAPHPAPRIPRPAPRITRPARRDAPAPATHGARALAFVRGLPDHSLTDRLVRGRAWIPILGVLLVGIVAMQVSLLRLNASMGRAIEQGSTLQTENGELRAQVASLRAVSRVERIASNMGMVMSTPAEMTFISPRSAGIRAKAIADMTAPSSSALSTIQAAASDTTQSTTASTAAAATTVASTSTPSTDSSTTTATGTAGTVAPPAQTAPSTAAPSTPTPTGTADPTGAGGTQAAAGTVGAGQLSSGGASSTGAGG